MRVNYCNDVIFRKKKAAAAAASETVNGANGEAAAGGAEGGQPKLDEQQLKNLKKAMDMLQLRQAAGATALAPVQSAPKTTDDAGKKKYEFWSTQPVPKIDEEITTNEEINVDIPLDKLRQEPYSLPAGFVWDTLNLNDPLVLKELYVLLNENYVEDDDNIFR